jgi:hypothetical protein
MEDNLVVCTHQTDLGEGGTSEKLVGAVKYGLGIQCSLIPTGMQVIDLGHNA